MSASGQLYFNGDICTMDALLPIAKAVAIRDGFIIAAGSENACRSALGSDYEEINLKGAALLPGFIDTHLHPVPLVYYNMNIDMLGTSSLADLKQRINLGAAKAKGENWLVGLNFDEQSLDVPVLPDRHILDSTYPDRPLIIIKHDGHSVMANTPAIKAANISADTATPAGGIIEHQADGQPSGIFRETATQLILSAMPMPDMESLTEGVKSTFFGLVSQGITSIGAVLQTDEDGPAGALGTFDVPAMEIFLDQIPVNLYCLIIAKDMDKIKPVLTSRLNSGEKGRHRVGGLKIIADGTFGSCTALMSQPFSDHLDKSGFLLIEPEEIYRRMLMAHREGLQVEVHAIGDDANRVCVGLFKRLLSEHPRKDHRHRLQHASLLDARLISEIDQLGLVISTQPQFIHSEKHWLYKRLGADRLKWVYPFRSLLDAGIKLGGASDAPVESTDVLHSIQVCVTREGFETQQCITAREAVRMFTIDAAYIQFEENVKGSISAGKRADLVILSANPISAPAEEISRIRVERTIVAGKTVFQA